MPEGAVCCPLSGGYCDAGYTCTADDKCTPSSGGGSSGGGSGGGGSSTCDAGRIECDSDYCIPSDGTCCGIGQGNYCKVSPPPPPSSPFLNIPPSTTQPLTNQPFHSPVTTASPAAAAATGAPAPAPAAAALAATTAAAAPPAAR